MRRSAFFLTVFAFLAVLVTPNVARAQDVDPWTAIQQVLADLKADRQAVVAAPRRPHLQMTAPSPLER